MPKPDVTKPFQLIGPLLLEGVALNANTLRSYPGSTLICPECARMIADLSDDLGRVPFDADDGTRQVYVIEIDPAQDFSLVSHRRKSCILCGVEFAWAGKVVPITVGLVEIARGVAGQGWAGKDASDYALILPQSLGGLPEDACWFSTRRCPICGDTLRARDCPNGHGGYNRTVWHSNTAEK